MSGSLLFTREKKRLQFSINHSPIIRTGSTIGIAWMGTVCYADAFLYQQLYWVSSTGVTTINPYEWIVGMCDSIGVR